MANGGNTCPATQGQMRNIACNTQACPVLPTTVSSYSSGGLINGTVIAGGTIQMSMAISGTAGVNIQYVTVQRPEGPFNLTLSSSQTYSFTTTTSVVFTGFIVVSQAMLNGWSFTSTVGYTLPNGSSGIITPNAHGLKVTCGGGYLTGPGGCSATCGGGLQNKTYHISQIAANGGIACGATEGTVTAFACNTQACPANCTGYYYPNSTCSVTCGGGTKTETFNVTTAPSGAGTACPASTRVISCNTQRCPVCPASWPAPWSQQGNALIGLGTSGYFDQGDAVALSLDGTTMAAGGSGADNGIGAVWMYTRDATGLWTQQTNIRGTGYIGTYVKQGAAVALSSDGNTLAFGGPSDNADMGAVWLFVRDAATNAWSQQIKLTPPASATPRLGSSVSLSSDGNTLAVGAFSDNNLVGATFVYVRSGTSWSPQGNKLVGG